VIFIDFVNQSPPCEADVCSSDQEIPLLLRNPKINYHNYESPPMNAILSRWNPIHNLTLYLYDKLQYYPTIYA